MSTTSGDSHLITNIYVNIFTSLALIKFYIERKPMQDKTSNTLEIINECFTLGSFYSMFVFTDFVPEIETRYRTGFKAIYLFLIVSIVNIFSIFYQLAQHVRIQYLKKRYMKAWTAHYELEGRMNDYIIYQCIKRDIKVTQKQVEELTFEQKKQKIDQLNDQNCHDITFLDVMGIQGQDENKKVDESTGTPRFKKVEIIDQQKFNNIIELNMLEREVEFD
jgi:ABC-type multidrug transport system fused ATPase/permease subunit